MGRLKSVFSWSFSAAEDFEQCRRRRYWSKYAMWGGWEASASDEQKTAYRLNKMDNRWGLMGQAAERAIMWVLKENQLGVEVTAEQAWKTVARPFLTQKWTESLDGKWKQKPKQFCCLREHYYEQLDDDNAAKREIADQVKLCIENFITNFLPRFAEIDAKQEIRIATPEMSGDSEHFVYEGVKVYAIPDYVYRVGDQVHIHDWKAGRMKPEQHRLQLATYALWAIVKYGVSIENIFLYVEYLKEGKVFPFQLTESEMDETRTFIGESVGEMSEYLVDYDREKNQALPKDEWELTLDLSACKFCNFYELCQPELAG
ncbi:MAG: PD-(D/E)XK nuclease family protein [Pontiellaceae bacterium]